MRVSFTENSWKDYISWQTEDKKTLKRINDLIKAISRDPFSGVGKPEPLKSNLTGYWSRRIDKKNRLVYEVLEQEIIIVSCKYHY